MAASAQLAVASGGTEPKGDPAVGNLMRKGGKEAVNPGCESSLAEFS